MPHIRCDLILKGAIFTGRLARPSEATVAVLRLIRQLQYVRLDQSA